MAAPMRLRHYSRTPMSNKPDKLKIFREQWKEQWRDLTSAGIASAVMTLWHDITDIFRRLYIYIE